VIAGHGGGGRRGTGPAARPGPGRGTRRRRRGRPAAGPDNADLIEARRRLRTRGELLDLNGRRRRNLSRRRGPLEPLFHRVQAVDYGFERQHELHDVTLETKKEKKKIKNKIGQNQKMSINIISIIPTNAWTMGMKMRHEKT
jgi:hypothetical protein